MSNVIEYVPARLRRRVDGAPMVVQNGDAVRVSVLAMDSGKASPGVADTAIGDARRVANDAYAAFRDSASIAPARVSLSDMAAKVPAGVDRYRAAEAFRMIDHGDVAGGLAGVNAMIGSHLVASTLNSSPDRRAQHKAAVDFLEGVVAVVEATKVAK